MDDEQKQRIEARLRQRIEEIERTRGRLRREGENMRDTELSNIDQHPADEGTEMHEQELDETTQMMLDEERTRINEALTALENGTYGTCIECGREIQPQRLEVRPDAVRCIDHQREYEARLRQTSGPAPGGQL